jgi:hypothetical protein
LRGYSTGLDSDWRLGRPTGSGWLVHSIPPSTNHYTPIGPTLQSIDCSVFLSIIVEGQNSPLDHLSCLYPSLKHQLAGVPCLFNPFNSTRETLGYTLHSTPTLDTLSGRPGISNKFIATDPTTVHIEFSNRPPPRVLPPRPSLPRFIQPTTTKTPALGRHRSTISWPTRNRPGQSTSPCPRRRTPAGEARQYVVGTDETAWWWRRWCRR